MPVEVRSDYADAPKINIPPDFDIGGKFGVMDMFVMIVNSVLGSELWEKWGVLEFAINVRNGDMKTIMYLTLSLVVGFYIMQELFSSIFDSSSSNNINKEEEKEGEEKEVIPLRDFTVDQLREFDGTKSKPIYIALQTEVYDVTSAGDFYGEGSHYNIFAGRDATRAMAKLSFDEEDLANPSIKDLGPFHKDQLEQWVQKFKYHKCYPIIGRVSSPPKAKDFTREELKPFKGLQAVPEGRVDAPILMGISGKVLDVSYGGKEMYGEGGPYHLFSGIDASRALAKMSFSPENLTSCDTSDLTLEEAKVLSDWEKKFIEVRKYPVVGTLI